MRDGHGDGIEEGMGVVTGLAEAAFGLFGAAAAAPQQSIRSQMQSARSSAQRSAQVLGSSPGPGTWAYCEVHSFSNLTRCQIPEIESGDGHVLQGPVAVGSQPLPLPRTPCNSQ